MIFNKKVLSSCCVGLALFASGQSFGMRQSTEAGSSRGANGANQNYLSCGCYSTSSGITAAPAGQFVMTHQTPGVVTVRPLGQSGQLVHGSSLQQSPGCPAASEMNSHFQFLPNRSCGVLPGVVQGPVNVSGSALEKKDNGGKSEMKPTATVSFNPTSFASSMGGQGQKTHPAGQFVMTHQTSGAVTVQPLGQSGQLVHGSSLQQSPSCPAASEMNSPFQFLPNRSCGVLHGVVQGPVNVSGSASGLKGNGGAGGEKLNTTASLKPLSFAPSSSGSVKRHDVVVNPLPKLLLSRVKSTAFDAEFKRLQGKHKSLRDHDPQLAVDLGDVDPRIANVLPGGQCYANNVVSMYTLSHYYEDETVHPDWAGYVSLGKDYIHRCDALKSVTAELQRCKDEIDWLNSQNDVLRKRVGDQEKAIEDVEREKRELAGRAEWLGSEAQGLMEKLDAAQRNIASLRASSEEAAALKAFYPMLDELSRFLDGYKGESYERSEIDGAGRSFLTVYRKEGGEEFMVVSTTAFMLSSRWAELHGFGTANDSSYNFNAAETAVFNTRQFKDLQYVKENDDDDAYAKFSSGSGSDSSASFSSQSSDDEEEKSVREKAERAEEEKEAKPANDVGENGDANMLVNEVEEKKEAEPAIIHIEEWAQGNLSEAKPKVDEKAEDLSDSSEDDGALREGDQNVIVDDINGHIEGVEQLGPKEGKPANDVGKNGDVKEMKDIEQIKEVKQSEQKEAAEEKEVKPANDAGGNGDAHNGNGGGAMNIIVLNDLQPIPALDILQPIVVQPASNALPGAAPIQMPNMLLPVEEANREGQDDQKEAESNGEKGGEGGEQVNQ